MIVKQLLRSSQVNVIFWLSQSLDFNPIEDIWSEVERRVRGTTYQKGEDLFIQEI